MKTSPIKTKPFTVVFFQDLDYNCQIMNSDAKGERPLGEEVDAIFQDSYGVTTKGRIELAAHAISTCVNQLDFLEDQQRKSHESVGSASRLDISLRAIGYSAIFAPVIPPEIDNTEKTGVEHILELFEGDEANDMNIFTPIEKAKLSLSALTDGIRAAHNLSRFQANRAIALSRKQAYNRSTKP
ncbi:MAG: hypothetical protein JWN12_289 [Candidatus Saccharibacteria bacterium]|nr:hypothetical protein [Candidatus Saccharibacteria bacterium]